MLRQVLVQGRIPVSVRTKPSDDDQGQTRPSDGPTLLSRGAEDMRDTQVQASHSC